MHNLDDLWPCVVEERERFASVRDWLRENRSSHGDGKALADLQRRLSRLPHNNVIQLVDGAIAPASAIMGAIPTGSAIAGVSLKAASTIRPVERAVRLVERITRPELHVLRTFQSDAALVSASAEDVKRIWGQEPNASWLAAIATLGNVGGLGATKVRPSP